jgi:phage terminase Nu1 subunit (DNA packaging protein)
LALSSQPDDRTELLVNMRELALRLGVSRQTLSTWLDRWPDFPIETRGTNGREYRFDVTAVFGFLRQKKDEQAASAAARDEALAQLILPFATVEAEEPAGLPLKDQLSAIKIRKANREEAFAEGKLAVATEVADALSTAFQRLGQALRVAVREAAREHNLPEPVRRSLETNIADAQRAFVRAAATYLTPNEAPDAE